MAISSQNAFRWADGSPYKTRFQNGAKQVHAFLIGPTTQAICLFIMAGAAAAINPVAKKIASNYAL